jgi:TRAP-type C4-dicarboxylate transport system permease small subunit
MQAMHRTLDRVEDAFAFLASCMIVFTIVFVPLDVGSRYFFAAPITWVYEVTEYILLMVPCLGMAWLARLNGHVVIDVLTSRLEPRTQRRLEAAMFLLVALACAFIAWWGGVVTLESYKARAIIENVLQTPQWLIYVSIPVGFALTAAEFARKGAHAAWTGG